jgi:hypothetical protein
VTHTFTPYDSACYFNTTLLTDDAFVSDTSILFTRTLIVLNWSEDTLVEKTMLFRALGSVVNGLRLGDLAK